ncbi:MAG: hypothetical protein O2960_16205 [Verrucomicrobia bacterium]|nr:hypothetical protein [Verrucomicrobiota bacterium]
MMTCNELFGFMTSGLATEILEYAYASDKTLYRTVMTAVAEAMKLRPVFLERRPRVERHKTMLDILSRPRFEDVCGNLLGGWLLKSETAMLTAFLDSLKVDHKEGVVQDFPESVPDEALTAAIEKLLSDYPQEKVVVYLNAFCSINKTPWKNLEKLLSDDSRLQLA